jgi:hypothetical protein
MLLTAVLQCIYFFLGVAGLILTAQGLRGLHPGKTVMRVSSLMRPNMFINAMFTEKHLRLLHTESFEFACVPWGALMLLGSLFLSVFERSLLPQSKISAIFCFYLMLSCLGGVLFGLLVRKILSARAWQHAVDAVETEAQRLCEAGRLPRESLEKNLNWFPEVVGRKAEF